MANRKVIPLTDTQIKSSKPKEKEYNLSDGNGLQLVIKTDGNKIWEVRYTIERKPKQTTIGSYPTVSLAMARSKRDEIKTKAINGIDYITERKDTKLQLLEEKKQNQAELIKLNNTFKKVSEDFFNTLERSLDENYHSLKYNRLENHVFPYIGNKPISEVSRQMIIDCVERIASDGKKETARRVCNIIGQVYKYAVVKEYVPHNIVVDIDKRYIIGKKDENNYPTLVKDDEIAQLLRDIDNYTKGEVLITLATKFSYLTAQRQGTIRFAEWDEFDFEKMEWHIPAEKMKMKRPHIVPISKQLKQLLDEIAKYKNGTYLFYQTKDSTKVISENAVNGTLHNLGYKGKIVAHGFRAMFTTVANEHITEHGIHTDVIESFTAHQQQNKVKRAYNHSQYIKEKHTLAQWWADYLDVQKTETFGHP